MFSLLLCYGHDDDDDDDDHDRSSQVAAMTNQTHSNNIGWLGEGDSNGR